LVLFNNGIEVVTAVRSREFPRDASAAKKVTVGEREAALRQRWHGKHTQKNNSDATASNGRGGLMRLTGWLLTSTTSFFADIVTTNQDNNQSAAQGV